ncbi:NADH:flavin oxidoreductase/NADH oxidase family protein [Duganella sp. LX20W]|uniref:NADH:flavin oxidoreductase/NADH oxidase family protein n=1 Tax=Rugamonas brunnea TaxID=2758569 RepID=A0A7W2ESY6_9BURK|nr:NADH:flavin oxidoreductase/NADH oxidase family protein [Rugamonas brunnea]MBA5637984.1 NADH:flavin oxidoreductase/NADH oxidase family protein [Rugamonas brunnea]
MHPFSELVLPNGAIVPNRLAKAAMEENMADDNHAPSDDLIRLYKSWADGGVGLIITGNVMIDRRAMTGPGGVVLESETAAPRFREWAKTARSGGAQIWMQINHPGRQMPAAMGQEAIAPSAIAMELGDFSSQFATPREMSEDDIADVRRRFVKSAQLAEQFGFNGVEVHAAHGYLISQFLSPITNKRTDQWGGPIANRARLLVEVVKEIRQTVGKDFAVAVKLNSADFQRGGFSTDDAKTVIAMLNPLGVDMIELSGGSYEAPAMMGHARDDKTLAREAYFVEFAKDIATVADMPVMVTGGIRRYPVVKEVLDSGIDMVGMGTALAINPHLPKAWRSDQTTTAMLRAVTWKNKVMASAAVMAMVKYQLQRVSKGKPANPNVRPLFALLGQQLQAKKQNKRYRRWMSKAMPHAQAA